MARLGFFLLALVAICCPITTTSAQNAVPSATPAHLPLEAPPVGSAKSSEPVKEADPKELAALIERLGHDEYAVRQEASAKLAAIGLPAKAALMGALKHDDPEVRLRARHLLSAIQAADLELRLKAFLADVKGEKNHDLPCWDQFRKLAGENEAARKLFVEMQRLEGALLESAAGGGDVAAEGLRDRCFHWQTQLQIGYSTGRQQPPPFAVVAALLLVAGDDRTKTPDNLHMQLYNFVQQQPFQQAVNDAAQADRAKRLLGSWIRGLTGPTTAQYGIQLATQWNLPEGLPLARKVSENKAGTPYIRAQALATIAKLGDKSDLPMLQGLLSDAAMCTRRVTVVDGKRVEMDTQMRDVALAAMVHLTGQKFDEYGFKDLRPSPPYAFHYSQVYFPSPAARDTAMKKWQEWSAKNIKTETPKGGTGTSAAGDKPNGTKPAADPAKDAPGAGPAGTGPAGKEPPAKADPVKAKKAAPALGAAPVAPAGVVVAVKGAVVKGGMVADANDAEPAQPSTDAFFVADREAGLNLQRARKLIEEGQYTAALRALDSILAETESRSYQPEIGRPLFLSLKLEARHILGQLPPDGRKAYELLVGHQARQALDEAVATGDIARLDGVARRYIVAAAGQEAALMWGEHLLNTGRPLAAAMALTELRQLTNAPQRFEPLLSLRIAHAWLAANLPEQARESLKQLKAPSATEIDVAGQRLGSLDQAEGVLNALQRVVTTEPRRATQPGEWLVFRGNGERNDAAGNDPGERTQGATETPGRGNIPWLRRRWLVEPATTPAVRDAIRALDVAYRQERLALLPTGHLLTVADAAGGETVLARTTSELLAIASDTGAVRWRAPLMDGLDEAMAAASVLGSGTPAPNINPQAYNPQAANAAAMMRGVDERVWNDLTYGTLASDGRYVFLVEDVGVAQGLSLRGAGGDRMTVQRDGSRRLNSNWPGESTRLTAYDIRTGKFRWEIGGPRGRFELDLAGAYFLGPPLPHQGKLYVMAEWDQSVCLLTLEAPTGRLLQRTPLTMVESTSAAPSPFGFAYAAPPTSRAARRRAGASPAYAQGVLVCPTSGNSFAAVDVATGEIRWTYRPMRLEEPAVVMNPFMFGMQNRGSAEDPLRRDDRWAEGAVTIVGQNVLLTPRDSDKLLCVDLRGGRLLWEAPREDALYLAGVSGAGTRDVALLVGRSSLRGLKISDGRAAWERLPLPAGSSPSGRGCFTQGRTGGCYVQPLSSAEVAVIDVASGRLLQRSRSVDGRVPGNLVAAKGHVVSQGPEGVESYASLESVLAASRTAAAARSNDAAVNAELGRMLLARGDHAESIAQLRRAWETQRDSTLRVALCEAVLTALESDFAAHHGTARELAAAFQDSPLEAAYHRTLAIGLLRSEQRLAAFDALMAFGRQASKENGLEGVDAARSVRREIWLTGQIRDLLSAASPVERTELDQRITKQLEAAMQSPDGSAALAEFITRYPEHPSAATARDQLLARYFAAGSTATQPSPPSVLRPLQVERLLLEQRAGQVAARTWATTARLAQLMRDQDRHDEAAELYRQLSVEAANVACLDGKTGRQLFDALPANSPVRQALAVASPWPTGIVEKQPSRAGNFSRTSWPLQIDAVGQQMLDGLSLEISTGMPFRVIARDPHGTERWTVELKLPSQPAQMAYAPQAMRARIDGHLLLVWQGNYLFAVDMLGRAAKKPELLWAKDLTAKFPGQDSGPGQQVVFFAGGAVMASNDPYGRPVAEVGPVTGRYIAYQRLRAVTAVDSVTGEPLWTRHDLPQRCELIGDDEVVIAVPRDGELARDAAAVVLRARDGRDLGRCSVPDSRQRLAVYGRRVLTWTGDDNGQTLRLHDPWLNRDAWTRDYPAGSKLSRIGVDEAAILDPQGNFVVLSLPEGVQRIRSAAPGLTNLLDIHVLRSADRYLLLAKQSQPGPTEKPAEKDKKPDEKEKAADKPAEKMVYPLSLGGQTELVTGTLFGFDRRGGDRLWQMSLDQRGLDLSQSSHWPMLVFAEQIYYQQPGITQRNQSRVTCVDKRDGRVLFEQTAQAAGAVMVGLDAANHAIDVRTNNAGARLVFTGKPLPGK